MDEVMDDYEDIFDQIRGICGEHFHSWSFAVVTEDGDFYSDATNPFIGEALFNRAAKDYACDLEPFEDFDWDYLDDDDDE